MFLVSALGIGLACLAVTILVALQAIRRERALRELEVAAARRRAEIAERQLFVQSREELADAAADPLTLPAEITRATHQSIAAIPFGILEQIPATAESAKAVREIHDDISRTVYQAISGTTRGIAGLVRGGLAGPPRRRPSPQPRPLPAEADVPAIEPTDGVVEIESPRRRPRPTS